MQMINMHKAKSQLSSLVEGAMAGESFIIAKAGKPMVKVIRMEAPEPKQQQRLGFMTMLGQVPDNFDQIEAVNIQERFEG